MKTFFKSRLSVDYESRIRASIVEAESKTSVEIVPMIVRSSAPSFHVFPILVLVFLSFAGFLETLVHMDAFYPVPPMVVRVILGAFGLALSWWLSDRDWVVRLLTPDAEEVRSVEARAQLEFYSLQVDQTLAKTGVLLFLSLRERRAVVLADRSVSEKLDPKVWSEVIETLIKTAGQNDLTSGICEAIKKTGELASTVLPRSVSDKNEIQDKLIVKI